MLNRGNIQGGVPMKKLISFCLYGDNPKYIMGFYKNIALKEEFYPDWDIIVFHDSSVESKHIEEYRKLGVITRDATGFDIHPTALRFLAFDEDDSYRVVFRDADSRLSLREAEAVKEWEDSNKPIHIMRDHPNHGNQNYPIFAGMWGIAGRMEGSASMLELIMQYQGGPKDYKDPQTDWGTDQNFLRDCLYSFLGTEQHSMIHAGQDYMKHATCCKNESWAKDFPSPRSADSNFIGEIFNCQWDGSESREDYYKDIIKCI